jgi:hypothetical protein
MKNGIQIYVKIELYVNLLNFGKQSSQTMSSIFKITFANMLYFMSKHSFTLGSKFENLLKIQLKFSITANFDKLILFKNKI